MIRRTLSYRTYTHDGVYSLTSNREEEITAMKMFNFCKSGGCYEKIGEILDYQTPLKDRQRDKAGKIDLLAYDGKILRMLELKKPHTGETMLRCVLEGYTYLRTADTANRSLSVRFQTNTKFSDRSKSNSPPCCRGGLLYCLQKRQQEDAFMAEKQFTQSEPIQTGDDLTCPNCGNHRVWWLPYPKFDVAKSSIQKGGNDT